MNEDPSSLAGKQVSSGRPRTLFPHAARLSTVITIQDKNWLKEIPALEALAREALLEAAHHPDMAAVLFSREEICPEISVCFSDDETLRALNRDYRNKDRPTNVLSFPGENPEEAAKGKKDILLGDIVLAFETVLKEAKERYRQPSHHVAHLLVHGLLHLAGFVHDTSKKRKKMEALEIEILHKLGIDNPYVISAG